MLKNIIDTLNGTTRRKNQINVAAGTAVGVLLGAATGILLAPKSGHDTRNDIADVAKRGYKEASEAAKKTVKYARKEASILKSKVNDLKKHGRHVKDIAEDAVEDLGAEM
ncbi:MAG: YtxH domain-containing protein, partial [Erysipelotrichaceae bacterium]|nr:YtxH domain-containing protein [Erysipelotrichaceae bacterium]